MVRKFTLSLCLATLLPAFASADTITLGEYTGAGTVRYADNFSSGTSWERPCNVALNASYDSLGLSYDFAFLCDNMNDRILQLRSIGNDLYLVAADGSLSGPVGTRSGARFDFALAWQSTVRYRCRNDGGLGGPEWREFPVSFARRIEYGFEFRSDGALSFRRAWHGENAPFHMGAPLAHDGRYVLCRDAERFVNNAKYLADHEIRVELRRPMRR